MSPIKFHKEFKNKQEFKKFLFEKKTIDEFTNEELINELKKRLNKKSK